VRRAESLLSGSRGERGIERSAADEPEAVAEPRPSPGRVRVGRFRNASRRTDRAAGGTGNLVHVAAETASLTPPGGARRDDGRPPFVVSPPPPPDPPSAHAAAAGWSGPDARDDADDDAADDVVDVSAAFFVDPRGTWHSDVRPPAPRYPSRPPAPFPPLPGVPPFPLGVYAKLQAVPRCSPFCDTRAPPPSLPRGDRRWPALVAAAAEKQWAQIADLAQIQIGGSAFTGRGAGEGHGVFKVRSGTSASAEHRAESGHEWGGGQFGGDAETSGTDVREVGPFFAPSAGAELKRHARRAASVESMDESEIRAR
jgi:hypothetical protein